MTLKCFTRLEGMKLNAYATSVIKDLHWFDSCYKSI